MADIKTRNKIKSTIKTINKAAIASERMKIAYAKTKDKAEQGYYAEENSLSEYAADRVSNAVNHVKDEGMYQINKQGIKSINSTRVNIVKLKKTLATNRDKRILKAEVNRKPRTTDVQSQIISQSGETHSVTLLPDNTTQRKLNSHVSHTQHSRKVNLKLKLSSTSTSISRTPQQSGKNIKYKRSQKAINIIPKRSVKTTGTNIKTAQSTSKIAIKTAKQPVKAAQTIARTTISNNQKAKKIMHGTKVATRAIFTTAKMVLKATISTTKAIITGTKALITALLAGGWIALLIILVVVLFGCALSFFGSNENSYTPISAEVEAYEPLIQKYAKQHGIPEYVELIKAVMMQESGGRGNDPMQTSESGYNTMYPNSPGSITDPEYSINIGIKTLAESLKEAQADSPIDMEHIKLALQAYNFGNGYISWATNNYGGYSITNAIEFSSMMAQKYGWERYGDTQYVAHVLRYYPFGRAFSTGSKDIVDIAISQLGNVGGEPYWSWYGFDSRVEWCACFVSWCADRCGYLDSGVIPKFSACIAGVNWFKDRGQWQDRNYEPSAGDIIFYDWDGDGISDHVGIVENCEDGKVHTIEGNTTSIDITGDVCAQKIRSGSTILGYGIPEY